VTIQHVLSGNTPSFLAAAGIATLDIADCDMTLSFSKPIAQVTGAGIANFWNADRDNCVLATFRILGKLWCVWCVFFFFCSLAGWCIFSLSSLFIGLYWWVCLVIYLRRAGGIHFWSSSYYIRPWRVYSSNF